MRRYLLPFCSFLLPLVALGQGSLTPSGPPVPGMKRLDQVEPRTAVNTTTTPGNDTTHFVINTAGSYYLTANLSTNKPVGILISSAGVTLDLNGFNVSGGTSGSGRGILIASNGATVRNGSIRGWETGITTAQAAVTDGSYERLLVSRCMSNGIVTGGNWLVDRCVATGNDLAGIAGTAGTRVTNCIASGNGIGISLTSGGSVTDSTASGNKFHGIFGNGVTITGCTAEANEQHGINVGTDSVVRDNKISGNGVDTTNAGAGVHVFGDRNRIIGNTISGNDKGIFVTSRANMIDGNNIRGAAGPGVEITMANGKNIIIRNQAGDNGGSYTAIAAGNNLAPVTAPESATNPYGNILN